MDKKGNMLMILGVVAILAIIGMVLLFKSAMTGQGIYANVHRPGGSIYGEGVPVYSYNCQALHGEGWVWTQGGQNFDPNCIPAGVRREEWQRQTSWGEETGVYNPQIFETQGWCCPIGANV